MVWNLSRHHQPIDDMIERLDPEKWLEKYQLEIFPEPESVFLKHPVLLCHGYGAIASLLKPSPLYDVALLMRKHNVAAFAPNIVPYATIETRAEGWSGVIQKLSEKIKTDKVNIIAHSMGGLDIRYAISEFNIAPHVASLTTVCTPHRGTSLAELTLKTPDLIRDKVVDFLDWMGNSLYPQTKSDSVGSVAQLTREYVTEVFNTSIIDTEDIPFYSYTSAVGKGTDHPIKVIAKYQNNFIFEKEGPNDGFVSVASGKWGKHIKTANISHLEQINLRVKNDRKKLFDAFWLDVIKMLESEGH